MESISQLTDFERKLITVIQNSNRKGSTPSLRILELRTGRTESEIKKTIKDLIRRKWLAVHNDKIVVIKSLF